MEICQGDTTYTELLLFWLEPDVCPVHVDVLAIVWRAYSGLNRLKFVSSTR